MAIKGMLALVLVAVFAAIGAVMFSLDSMAASRDENNRRRQRAGGHPRSQRRAAARELRRRGAGERGRAGEGAQGVRRDPAAAAVRRPRAGPHDAEGHGRPDRAGSDLQHVGVRRPRRAGSGRARARGPDRRDDADERRLDPALDRLPRCAHRAERRVQGRRPGRVVHVPLQGERPGRLHVPLRHEARPRAHRERDVRRDRRQPGESAAEGRPRVRARCERVVSERRRHRGAREPRHGEGAGDRTRLDDLQRLREPVRHASADRRPGRHRALLGSSRQARRSTRTSTSSARSSTAHG